MRKRFLLVVLGTLLSDNVAGAQNRAGTDSFALPDPHQVQQWAKLFRNVLQEFILRADSSQATKWIEETVTVKDLLDGDLQAIARRLYTAARYHLPQTRLWKSDQ